jgi:hypothetical protein
MLGGVRVKVFSATSDISWLLVLLVEETGVPWQGKTINLSQVSEFFFIT